MQVLQFIKTHLISLLCGLVAIGAIVAVVLGVSSRTVVEEMKKEITQTGAGNISSLKSNPKNDEIIANEKRRGELFEEEYAKTVEEAKRINEREPLMSDVFPQPKRTATPYLFKQAYARTMETLYKKLDAGTLPTDAEIQEEQQNVEDLLLLEEEKKGEEEGDVSGGARRVASRARTAPPSARGPVAGGGRSAPGGGRTAPGSPGGAWGGGRTAPGQAPAGWSAGRTLGRPGESFGREAAAPGTSFQIPITRSDEPKYDPVYRARVAKAKSILCYYDPASFDVNPIAYQEDAPSPESMWLAQIGLWVQEDVVKAIAGLNKQAADKVTDGDACVQQVPVKRLVLMRVLGYALPKKGLWTFDTAPGGAAAPAVGVSFTGRRCNPQFDVVRFVVTVVVDQRDLLQVIDAISRVNFYQCLGSSYEAIDQQAEINKGYFYGTDPVVQATLEFEGYMAREVYAPLMPAGVRKVLGVEAQGG